MIADLNAHFSKLPGGQMVRRGLEALRSGRRTVEAEVVSIGSPRLRACGFDVHVSEADALDADRRLYALLSGEFGAAAHSQYNALIRELVSFERAVERVVAMGR